MKTGIAKLILILVCMVLTVTTITVGVFAATGTKRKPRLNALGSVNFATTNIEGEVVGKVSGYGAISGNNKYSGTFFAGDSSTATDENGDPILDSNGNPIGNSLKPWEMGTMEFGNINGELQAIVIVITIKNRGDRPINVKYLPPSTPENVTIKYQQALTESVNVSDSDWVDAMASDIGKIGSGEDVEDINIQRNKFYTFKMMISITDDGKSLEEVSLNFSFELVSNMVTNN